MGKEHATDRKSHWHPGMEDTAGWHAGSNTNGTSPTSPSSRTSTSSTTTATGSGSGSGSSPTSSLDIGQGHSDASTRTPPSTRALRSLGPAPFGLLPEKSRSRRATQSAPKAPENPTPPIAQAQTDPSSLTQKLWTAGWNTFGRLLPGGANDEPADLSNIDAVPPTSGESFDSGDILSFF